MAITSFTVIVSAIAIAVICQPVLSAVDYSQYGLVPTRPGKSCRDIYKLNPTSRGQSGYYYLLTDRPLHVYCDMVLECGGEKGWMRIADVNPAVGNCPHGWQKITTPVAACRPPYDNAGCCPVHFTTHNIPYNRVCGMVTGIQQGTPDGFNGGPTQVSIDKPYLDGVSITYGTPRKHIWSYAAGLSEDNIDPYAPASCPCSKYRGTLPLPFIHDHYYCESGTTGGIQFNTYFTGDPLWDGKGCGNQDNCCARPNLPWFFRQLPVSTSDNIEVRICYDQSFADESVLVKETQLYIQ